MTKWVLKTDWKPQHSNVIELQTMMDAAIPFREVWVIGFLISEYISFNMENNL